MPISTAAIYTRSVNIFGSFLSPPVLRRLLVGVPVKVPASFALAYLPVYFSDRDNRREGSRLVLHYPLMSALQGVSFDRPVTFALRDPKHGGERQKRLITWSPGNSTWFPTFSGEFETVPVGRSECRLTLGGAYLAPKGIVGRAFDAIAGVHVARASIAGLLREAAAAIEGAYTIEMAM